MSGLVVSLIQATPGLNTVNGRYKCNIAKGKSGIIWSVSQPDAFDEGPIGSLNCVTFKISKQANGSWSEIPMQVTGTSSLLATCEDIQILSPAPAINVQQLKITGQVFDLPFRNAGDWTWGIQRSDIQGQTPNLCDVSTRLELCFVFASLAPHGPLYPEGKDQLPQPDFGDQYFADLFRLFLPRQQEVIQNTISGESAVPWYVKRSVSTIFNLGTSPHKEFPKRPTVRWNPSSDRPSYLSPPKGIRKGQFRFQYGGLFELRRWIAGSFAYCSSFDLAALTELACALVLDGDGKNVLRPAWVLGTGNRALGEDSYGYINPGPLFSWPNNPFCDSPFFDGAGRPSADSDRVPLKRHCWIEVTLPGSAIRRVLDASQAVGSPPAAPYGTLARTQYLDLKIDQKTPNPGRLPLHERSKTNSNALICVLTPQYWTGKIGVMGVGAAEPVEP